MTDDQRKQIRDTSGKDVIALDISVDELEQRSAPSGVYRYDLIANKGG